MLSSCSSSCYLTSPMRFELSRPLMWTFRIKFKHNPNQSLHKVNDALTLKFFFVFPHWLHYFYGFILMVIHIIKLDFCSNHDCLMLSCILHLYSFLTYNFYKEKQCCSAGTLCYLQILCQSYEGRPFIKHQAMSYSKSRPLTYNCKILSLLYIEVMACERPGICLRRGQISGLSIW